MTRIQIGGAYLIAVGKLVIKENRYPSIIQSGPWAKTIVDLMVEQGVERALAHAYTADQQEMAK
jgi:hypothetical protein